MSGYDYFNNFSLNEFPDLDHSLEWCEEKILKNLNYQKEKHFQLPLLTNEVDLLLSYFTPIYFMSGEVVFKQNDPSRTIYWLSEGTLDVWLNKDTAYQSRLARIKNGNLVGEMGVFTKTLRSATVVAHEKSLLYSITEEDLQRLYDEQPHLGIKLDHYIINIISQRLVNANQFIRYMKSEIIEPSHIPSHLDH